MSADLTERIGLFRFVRDIPYRIGLSRQEQDYCCATKATMLQKLLAGSGLQTRVMCCRFRWDETSFPPELLAQAPAPENGHSYVEVLIPESNERVAVDPTWDRGLKTAGLPVAEWNGLNATVFAVKPSHVSSPQESASILAQINALPDQAWDDLYQKSGTFFAAVNDWLHQQRSNPKVSHA